MNKVKITADAVLKIIQAIFGDEDVNLAVDDTSAPEEWRGRNINDILNVEYYTFKHRPQDTWRVVDSILESSGEGNRLAAVNRSFCLLSLGEIERLFSKDVDMVTLPGSLEYVVQTEKVKLIESLIEDSNRATCGLRIPVSFGDETRKVVIFFGRPVVSDIRPTTPFGEIAVVTVAVTLIILPNVASYSDYTIKMKYPGCTEADGVAVPLSSFSTPNTMTQQAVPRLNRPQDTDSINLSRARSFVLVFDGYDNPFVNWLTERALSNEVESLDNNETLTLIITRGEKTYSHEVVIKDHQIIVNADTGNETHTLTLVPHVLRS